MPGYIAYFKREKYEFHAETAYKARLAAENHFKPSKRDRGLLSVILVETDEADPVFHHPGELP